MTGLVLGAIIVVAALVAAIIMTGQGHPLSGGLLGGGGMVGLAAVFVYGARLARNAPEPSEKSTPTEPSG